jgi:hypothetical protein
MEANAYCEDVTIPDTVVKADNGLLSAVSNPDKWDK